MRRYVCFSISIGIEYDDSEQTEEDAINKALADIDLSEFSADNVEVFESETVETCPDCHSDYLLKDDTGVYRQLVERLHAIAETHPLRMSIDENGPNYEETTQTTEDGEVPEVVVDARLGESWG